MLARCARCQGTFTTDRYGRLTCPHCGAELILAEPPGTEGPTPRAPVPAAPPEGTSPPPAGGEPAVRPPPAEPLPPPAGAWGAPPPPPWGGAGWGPYPPPSLPEAPAPFAERDRRGFLAAFFETWKLVATQPQQFFARVRIDQTWTAVLFGVIATTVGNAAASVYGYFSRQQATVAFQSMMENLPDEQARLVRLYLQGLSGGATIAQLVLTPLLSLIGIYVASAVLHLLLMLFRGASRGFDATLTLVAYVSGLNLLLAVPGCGWILAGVWAAIVTIVGLGAIQRCGTGKATVVVLAPAILACACACGVGLLSVPALLKGLKQGAPPPTTTL
jgi:DNA-directed RNA polymerase subunit RPC12/RpoP